MSEDREELVPRASLRETERTFRMTIGMKRQVKIENEVKMKR